MASSGGWLGKRRTFTKNKKTRAILAVFVLALPAARISAQSSDLYGRQFGIGVSVVNKLCPDAARLRRERARLFPGPGVTRDQDWIDLNVRMANNEVRCARNAKSPKRAYIYLVAFDDMSATTGYVDMEKRRDGRDRERAIISEALKTAQIKPDLRKALEEADDSIL